MVDRSSYLQDMRQFKLPEPIELVLQLATLAAFASLGFFYFTEVYPQDLRNRIDRYEQIQGCVAGELATAGGNAETAKERCKGRIQ